MATYRATLTVEIERTDGAKSVVTETVVHHGGDNPRFESYEAEVATEQAVEQTFARLPMVEVPLNAVGSHRV